MKSNFLRKLWLSVITLMLCSAAFGATQYCDTEMTSSVGWNGNYTLSAEKSGTSKTVITIAVDDQQITGFYQLQVRNTGGGSISKTIWDPFDAEFSDESKFKVASDKKSATITLTWTSYPSTGITLYLVMRRDNSGTYGGGSDIFGNEISDIDVSSTCAPATSPVISVKPTSIIFKAYDETSTVKVTTANLTENVTITCPAGFEASPATISKDATSTDVTITCKTSSPTEFANVTFASAGAETATTAVRFRIPEDITFTGGNIENSGVHLKFTGYGTTYTSSQAEISKYKGSAKIGSSSSKLRIDAAQGDNLYCVLDWVPGASDVTVVTLEYENGDCGKATFTGTTFTSTAACGAVITVDPSSLAFTETNQEKSFTVSAEDLSNDISITSSSANFTVTPSSFTQAEAGGDVTVKFVGTAAEEATITVSSGKASKIVNVSSSFNPSLSVDPTSLKFTNAGPKTVYVDFAHLTEDITITSSSDKFTFTPSSISKDAATHQAVEISCSATEDLSGQTITFSSSSQQAQVAVEYKKPATIVFTGQSSLLTNQAFLYFTGYGETYEKVAASYTATIKSTRSELTTITPTNAEPERLWCITSFTLPNDTKDTTIVSLTYKNGDCGKVMFAGLSFNKTMPYGPSIDVDKETLSFAAAGQSKSIHVIADVNEDVTIESSSANFVANKASISKSTLSSTVTVTFNGSANEEATLTLTSGSVVKEIALSAVFAPTLTATPSSLLYTSAEGKTVSVGASSLTDDVTLELSGDGASYFSLSAESISKTETFPYDVTVNYKGGASATATLTISSTGAESQTVTLTGYNNTACSGYRVAAAIGGSAAQDIPYTYSITQTPAGHVTFTFTFTSVPTGFVPRIQVNSKGWRDMSGDLKRTYTTTADDFEGGVPGTTLTYEFLAAYANGSSGSAAVEYTLGTCETVLIESGGTYYTSLADAITAYTGSTINVLGDVNENDITIDKHILINANAHNIGDITVGTSGKLEFVTNGAAMKTFVVQNIPGTGAGQVVTNGNTITAEAAYLEREIYSGSHEELWYSFGVPFDVDARNGVYSTAGNKVNYGQYYIQKYDGANRAEYGILKYGQKGYAWSEVSTLEKGTGYMIYLMASCPKTLRFKASDASDLFTNVYAEQVNVTKYTGSAATTNHGWNFMAQPRMQNAEIQAGGGLSWGGVYKIQVLYEGGSDAKDYSGQGYTTEETDGLIMAPFTTYMFQAANDGFLNFLYNSSTEPTVKSAEDIEYKSFIVTLSNEAGKSDKFFASASEDALEDEYQLGRDLIKCGSSDSRLQICSEAFGQILTANDVKAYDGVGDMSLRLSIPKAGNYSIQVTRPASSGEIFLTKDGDVIADLTDGEAYEFASAKGVNTQYGLRIVLDEEITTDVSEADAEVSVYANDGIIYVNGVKAADVMNLLGQRVANPVAEGGIYLVNAGGKYVKINVE